MKHIIILLGCILFIGCKETPQTKKSPSQIMHEDIMKIHDEVMPKTADIHRLIKKLKAEKQTITQNNGSLLNMFDKVIKDLYSADDAMSEWMAQYEKPDFNDVSEDTFKALNKEKIKITDVRNKMLNAINTGNKFYAHIHKNNPKNNQ